METGGWQQGLRHGRSSPSLPARLGRRAAVLGGGSPWGGITAAPLPMRTGCLCVSSAELNVSVLPPALRAEEEFL